MNKRHTPITVQEFKDYIEANQGVTRQDAIRHFQQQTGNMHTGRRRLDSVQTMTTKAGWLFAQRKGHITKFYSTEYAIANGIEKSIRLAPRRENPRDTEAVAVLVYCERYKQINKLMPPNLNSDWRIR